MPNINDPQDIFREKAAKQREETGRLFRNKKPLQPNNYEAGVFLVGSDKSSIS